MEMESFRGGPPILAVGAAVRRRADGLLRIRDGKITRQLFFRQGNLARAFSNAKSETPGGFLQKKGRLDAAKLESFLAEVRTANAEPWAVAARLAGIPLAEAERLAAELAGQIALAVAPLPSADITFHPAPCEASGEPTHGVSLLVAMAACLPAGFRKALCPLLQPGSSIFPDEKAQRAFEPLPLDPEQLGLLNVVRSNDTVAEVFASSFLGAERIGALLLAYWLAGLVTLRSAEETARRKHDESLGEGERRLRAEILSRASGPASADYYRWLGVAPDEPPDTLPAKAQACIERFAAPGAVNVLLPAEQPLLQTLLDRLAEAKTVLSDRVKRAEYDRFLASGRTGSFLRESATVREESFLRRAAELNASGKPDEAIACYEAGLGELPASASLVSAYAKALLQTRGASDPSARDAALGRLREFLKSGNPAPQVFEAFALWASALGQKEKAVTAYRRAVELAPFSRPLWKAMDRLDPAGANMSLLEAYRKALPRLDLYRLLGTDRQAPGGEIQAAYRECAKRFHPDRFFQAPDPRLRETAKEVYKRMVEAYVTLKNPGRRKEYDAALEARPKEAPEESVPPPPEAAPRAAGGPKTEKGKRFYQLALEALRQGREEAARLNLTLGLQLEPDCAAMREKLAELEKPS